MANMTRKSLAVVATSALAFAGLTAAPAQAASVSTVLADGSTYVGLMGEEFNLTVSFSQDIANFNNAKILIGNADGLVFDVDATDINGAGDDVNEAVLAADDTAVVNVGAADGRSFNVSLGTPMPGEAGAVTVQAIIDNDGDDEASAGDILGPVRTVTFLDPADVTFGGTYADIAIGDETFELTVTVSDNVNVTQIDPAHFAATFTNSAGGDIGNNETVALDGDDMVFTVEIDADAAPLADADDDGDVDQDPVTAAGLDFVTVITYDDGVADAETSGQLLYSVAAAEVDGETDDTEATANLRANGGNWEARGGYTGTHTLVITFADGADAVEGVAVDVTVAENIDADSVVYANGNKLEDGDDDLEYSLTTDADGQIAITIRGTATDTDVVTVTWAAQGVTDSATLTWADAEVDSVVLIDYEQGVANAAAGDNVTVKTVLVDDFGVPAAGDYRVAFTGGDSDVFVATTNGYATATVEVADPVADIVATAQKKAAADGNYYALNNGALAADEVEADAETVTLTVNDADTDFAAKDLNAAIDDADIASLEEDYVSGDTRTGLFTSDYADGYQNAAGADAHAVVSVSVEDAAGADATAEITVSAAGLAFSSNDQVYTTDSITVYTAADGTAEVNVYGNVAGDYTITVSGAGLSEELDLEIAAVDGALGTTVAIDAPAFIAPGGSATITATVTDDWGNPIVTDDADADEGVTVEWDGPGLTVPVDVTDIIDTNADGQVVLRALMGANDIGEVTLTVTYRPDNVEDNYISESVTITVGAPAVATWTKNLGSGEVKMYAKNIVGAGKVQFMLNGEEIAWVNASSSADSKLRSANGFYYLVRTVELVEGQKNVLEIYVDGVRTTRTAYTY